MFEPNFIAADENGFKGSVLDEYLAAGYYRMQHNIFTTHYTQLETDAEIIPVFWLRTAVNKINENKAAVGIRKKCIPFTVTHKAAAITEETEVLYGCYQNNIDFNTAGSCVACLHDGNSSNPFNSRMIEIRHKEKLIAAGFFDVGQQAITGILNFYHPGYSKYSLGKYLMLQKIDWAITNKIEWYYTGYIGIGTTKFDYKIFPDAVSIEVFLPVENKWIPFEQLKKNGLAGYWINIFNKGLQ
jgi:leucyl-tRNA---protein transferase